MCGFNTQPPEGGWQANLSRPCPAQRFNTQPPEGGCGAIGNRKNGDCVSTHSRPKAAGSVSAPFLYAQGGFNTQPPEGGWMCQQHASRRTWRFNTQPPEGGWRRLGLSKRYYSHVSTHSRPKAAGTTINICGMRSIVSTHSRPKAAGKTAIEGCQA